MSTPFCVNLSNISATEALGTALAQLCVPGRQLCLDGPLGAGKSTLARAIIEQVCGPQLDIPSPTFTIVQPYDALAGYEVWHMDLYRLTTAQDAVALGIEEAFFDAACLIEWPDKIADLLPATAVTISLSITGELSRRAEIFASEQEQAIMSDMLGAEPS